MRTVLMLTPYSCARSACCSRPVSYGTTVKRTHVAPDLRVVIDELISAAGSTTTEHQTGEFPVTST